MAQRLEHPPGRNDPCPCGSGKKYKRCCLSTVQAGGPRRRTVDIVAEVRVAEERGDEDGAIRLLEEARTVLHDPDLDRMLLERYLELPVEEAEPLLRRWWEEEHSRFSGAGLAQILVT